MLKPTATTAETQNLHSQAQQLNDGHRRLLSLASQEHAANNILGELKDIISQNLPYARVDLSAIEAALQQQSDQSAEGYTIALCGRTGAGKSTLAAILSKTNLPTIGKGAQRTTKKTQAYRWENLIILDTPGISAANQAGRADERAALAAADTADMVILVVTEDGPQDTEATFLSSLDHQGKKIIALMNCKKTITTLPDQEDFLSHPEETFQDHGAEDRAAAFTEMAAKYTAHTPPQFHLAHFQSALVAQSVTTTETSQKLLTTSRLEPILDLIKASAADHAKISAVKTPFDIVLPKAQTIGRDYALTARQRADTASVFAIQRQQNAEWLKKFKNESQNEIKHFVNNQLAPLSREIPQFADQYAEVSNADREWQRRIERRTQPQAARVLTDKWQAALEKRAEAIEADLQANISVQYMNAQFSHINADKIHDSKRIVKWVSNIGSAAGIGGVGALSFLGLVTGPIGWIATGAIAAIGFVGNLLSGKSKKDKVAERAAEIRSSLNQGMTKIESDYRRSLNETLNKACREFDKQVQDALAQKEAQAKDQSDNSHRTSAAIRQLVTDNHQQLISSLLNMKSKDTGQSPLPAVGRIPGQIAILMTSPNQEFNHVHTAELAAALEEAVIPIEYTADPELVIRRCLNNERLGVEIAPDQNIAFIDAPNLDIDQVNRTEAAEQLAGLYISQSKAAANHPS